MKLPKQTKRYCKKCNKHTLHSLEGARQRGRSSARPLSRWSASRTRKRSSRAGYGNLGRFSKPPVKSWNRKVKTTKRIGILYKCSVCGKSWGIKTAIRSGRIEIGEKIVR